MLVMFLSLFLILAGGGGIAAASTTATLASNLETSFTATYTQTSTTEIKTEGTAPEGSSATFSTTSGNKNLLTANYSMTYTISGYCDKTIEAITLSMHSRADDGTGELFIKIGDEAVAEIFMEGYKGFTGVPFNEWFNVGSFSSSYVDVNVLFKDGADLTVGNDEKIEIKIEAYKNSLSCQSVSITWNHGSYSREGLTADKFGTICLPKGGVVKSGATFFEIAYKDNNGVYMDEVTELVAGVPYVFQATDTKLVIAHDGTIATEPISYNGLYGTFTEIPDVAATSDKTEYILANNQICECGSNCTVPANRAYLVLDEVPTTETPIQQGRRRVGMNVQGENQTTGLENTIVSTNEGIYDIMGRKVAEATASGFYIINGEKVFVVK